MSQLGVLLSIMPLCAIQYIITACWGLGIATWRLDRDCARRVEAWEVLGALVPFAAWAIVWILVGDKRLGSASLEPLLLGAVVSVLYLILRWGASRALSPAESRRFPIVAGAVAACAIAILVHTSDV